MKWTKNEEQLLLNYVISDNSEVILENIEHAHYMMYKEGNHPDLKERSLKACISRYYILTNKSTNN